MKELIIQKNDAGQRLDRFLAKAVPQLPASLLQKFIRLKKIRRNGKPAKRDERLSEGDVLRLYISDEYLEVPPQEAAYLHAAAVLSIVYEDENILLVDKKPGLSVHPHNGAEYGKTLIDQIQSYLVKKGDWNPRAQNAFTPALCNRIDRNTGGIVIAAKNAEALRMMNEKIRTRELRKLYLCVTVGRPPAEHGQISCFVRKDEHRNQVYVYRHPIPGGKTAITRYRVLAVNGRLSLVEVSLETGRTHQIRAVFADAGFPLLGDGKYGVGEVNRKYGERLQLLYAYRIEFSFETDAGILGELAGKTFEVPDVPFRNKYFF